VTRHANYFPALYSDFHSAFTITNFFFKFI
jgi:hypothetical protein